MWNQWSQYTGAPPLPTAAPPPPPQEPSGGLTNTAVTSAAPVIGPMLPPTGVAAQSGTLPVTPIASAATPTAALALPSTAGVNPYSQYTAAQYAAMTPEQQYALQQHWQQWQKYQEEYAKWHAQYGEQYKREMELAQAASKSAPPTPATPAYTSYYQQPPPTPAQSGPKITAQPQLYTQPPPPQLPVPIQNPVNAPNYPSSGPPVIPQPQPQHQQQSQPWQNQLPPFNRPPPNLNPQYINVNSSNINPQHFQQPPWTGGPPPPLPSQQTNSDNSGNRGPGSFQGPPNNRSGIGPENWSGGNGPNSRGGNWNINQNIEEKESSNNWNNQVPAVCNFESKSAPSVDDNKYDKRENFSSNDHNIGSGFRGQNNWNDGLNNGGVSSGPNVNRGPSNWNDGNNRGPNNWNDGPNNRGNNGLNEWNSGPRNRGPNERSFNYNDRGTSNWNDGRNNQGPNNWNDGSNNGGANSWNEGLSNRGGNNWNDGPNNRQSNNSSNDWNNSTHNRGLNDRNFGPNNRLNEDRWNSNNRAWIDRVNSGRENTGADNNNRGRNDGLIQRGVPGNNNRPRITDLDEEMFDRQFRQWEEQFEDWKKANANHPDKEMYKRYEQEFESQRKRIAERRAQMRRRKLEQMGLDPNQPPPQQQSREQCDSVGNDNSETRDSSGRKQNDSIESQQSSSKLNQEQNQNKNEVVNNANENAQNVQTETFRKDDKEGKEDKEDKEDKENKEDEDKEDKEDKNDIIINPIDNSQEKTHVDSNKEVESDATVQNQDTQQQKINAAGTLGKRKSRFDTLGPVNKIKPVEKDVEVINLDDDDEVDNEQSEGNQRKMCEIFKKVDDIPGLDLTEESPTSILEKGDQLKSENKKSDHKLEEKDQGATPKKIPSLFDIKVDKPDMNNLDGQKQAVVAIQASTSTGVPNAIPDLAKSLNDPDFLKKISEAVAHVKGGDQANIQNTDSRQMSFSEWHKFSHGDGSESKQSDDFVELHNTNSRDSFREKSSIRSEADDGMEYNFRDDASRGARDINRNMGSNQNMGPNNFGNNFGPNIWGPNGPNNWGPSGPNGPNNWGPNGPNNWGQNGSNGPNNWGPNGPNGSNNWRPNGPNGPNNWGPNGSNNNWGPNNNFGGPNSRGGNNFGLNRNSFGSGRSFDGSNFGPNDGPVRNFGREGVNFGVNDGSERNFGRNFSPNNGPGRNFVCDGNNFSSNDGPGRNFGRDGGNFGPSDGPVRNFSRDGLDLNRRSFGRDCSDGDRRNMGREGSKDRRDRSNSRSNRSKDGSVSDDNGPPSRNINNPFRRKDVPSNRSSLEADDGKKPKDYKDSWIKGPDGRDNIDYGDYYRPVQVIDYSNNASLTTTTIIPKVIDYGHKPVINDDGNDFKPLKIINYDHASKARNPQQQQSQQQQTRLTPAQKRRRRKNNKSSPQQQRNHNQQKIQNQKQQHQNQSQHDSDSTKTPNEQKSNEEKKDLQEQNKNEGFEKEDAALEEISDTEDVPEEPDSPPPPPPPLFNSSGTFTPFNEQDTPSSIFPSTAEANENLPKVSAAHVQMSIPTEENNNTISIDEILMKPGRQTRPKKLCIILRGPPGSGKSHVAKLIKEKEKEMGGNNPRILSIDDYFLIENDYEEKCPKTGKKIPKKEILYEYDKDMEEKYMEYLIKSFKKTVADNLYDFIVIDCNNNSLRSLNDFYCHSKDSGFVPYIIDLFCDLETCLSRNIHERSENDIKKIINTWKPTPCHYIKLDISSLLQNIVEMEDAEDMVVDDNTVSENADNNIIEEHNNEAKDETNTADIKTEENVDIDEDDSNDSTASCGFLKSKWETDTTTENLARLDGTSKLASKRKPTMEEYLQMDEWQPPTHTKGKKRVRWADIEEKREQEKMRAVGFVVGQTDWKRMMDPNAAKRALNKTKYIERVNKRR